VKQHPLYDNQATHTHDIRGGGTVVSWLHPEAVVQLSLVSNAVDQEEAVAGTAADHLVSNCYHYPGLGAESGGLHSPATTDSQMAVAENEDRFDEGSMLTQQAKKAADVEIPGQGVDDPSMASGHFHYSAVMTDWHPSGFVLQLHSPD